MLGLSGVATIQQVDVIIIIIIPAQRWHTMCKTTWLANGSIRMRLKLSVIPDPLQSHGATSGPCAQSGATSRQKQKLIKAGQPALHSWPYFLAS